MKFELDVFKNRLSAEKDNFCISPFGMKALLTLLLNGADAEAFKKMEQVLGNEGCLTEINKRYLKTMESLNDKSYYISEEMAKSMGKSNINPTLEIANSIWVSNKHPLQREFDEAMTAYYSDSMHTVDFEDPNTRAVINHWIADHTFNITQNLIHSIEPKTGMLAANAVAFKGKWVPSFSDGFKKTWYGEEEKEVPFMSANGTTMNCLKEETFTSVSVPYTTGLTLYCIMPAEGVDVTTLLTEENLDKIYKYRSTAEVKRMTGYSVSNQETTFQMETVNCNIFLKMPEFHTKTRWNIREALISLGLDLICQPYSSTVERHLDRIQVGGKNYMESSYQECNLEVNKNGTIATAATYASTSFGITGSCVAALPIPIIECTLDHPFVYLIRHNQTGEILFMGSVKELE